MYTPGTLLLWSALLLGSTSMICYLVAVKRGDAWRRVARQTFLLMTIAVVLAGALLTYLLITHDYRLAYVWGYSDGSLSLGLLISTFWAGQEGSFLLWIILAALIGIPLMMTTRGYENHVMGLYDLTIVYLLILLLRQGLFRFHDGLTPQTIPLDGRGLNPLLQNPWNVIHPPVMFLGYAAAAVPFVFALTALWLRRYDEWGRVSMPWVFFSFGALGAGIMLGAYWSYETLGWGGYWAWDPVENASLVPWLMTAALAHGLVLQEARGRFRRLNVVLAVMAYLFVVYATFLTRSGVLADFSVHSFGELGISSLLVLTMIGFLVLSVGMLLWRWRDIPSEVGDEPFFSGTIFSVLGILLLLGIGLMVAFGTSAPLITNLWTDPAPVGPDFYNRVGRPLAVLLAVFLGVVPFLTWRGTVVSFGRRLGMVLAATGVLTASAVWLGVREWFPIAYVASAVFCTVANGWAVVERTRRRRWRPAAGALSHVGIGMMLLAFLTTGVYDHEQKVRLVEGEPTEVLGYTLTFSGVEKPSPEARDAMVVRVEPDESSGFEMKPNLWLNEKTNQMVANPAIRSFLARDLYLAPSQYVPRTTGVVSARFDLAKGETGRFRDWQLTFHGFDMASEHGTAQKFRVDIVVEVQGPEGEAVIVRPFVVSEQGRATSVPAELPGTDHGSVRATGMDASQGLVRLELVGVGGGVGRTAVLRPGESFRYRDFTIRFDGYDAPPHGGTDTPVHVGAAFTVSANGDSNRVVARVGEGSAEPAEIPGSDGLRLEIGRVDAAGGQVEVDLFDPSIPAREPDPAEFVLDVATKPGIVLLWVGAILSLVGIVIVLVQRRNQVGIERDGPEGEAG